MGPHPLHPAAPEAWKFSAVASECLASEMSWHELRKKHVGRRSLDDADANLQGTKEPSLHGPSEGPLAPHLRLQVSSRLPRLGRLVAHTLGGKKCKPKRNLFLRNHRPPIGHVTFAGDTLGFQPARKIEARAIFVFQSALMDCINKRP